MAPFHKYRAVPSEKNGVRLPMSTGYGTGVDPVIVDPAQRRHTCPVVEPATGIETQSVYADSRGVSP